MNGQNASSALECAEKSFESVIQVAEPPSANWTVLNSSHWNDQSDALCMRGGRKPAWTIVMDRMDAGAWKQVADLANELRANYTGKGLEYIYIQAQNFYVQTPSEQAEYGGSYPWRSAKTHLLMGLQYIDPTFDPVAEAWGTKVRQLFRDSAEIDQPGA